MRPGIWWVKNILLHLLFLSYQANYEQSHWFGDNSFIYELHLINSLAFIFDGSHRVRDIHTFLGTNPEKQKYIEFRKNDIGNQGTMSKGKDDQ